MKKLFLLFFLSTNLFASPALKQAIVIDANEKQTVLHLFQYQPNNLPFIEEIFTIHNDINIVDAPDISLQTLLQQAKDKITSKEVSFQLYGNHNVQSLPLEKQIQLYQRIDNFIQKNYHFQLNPSMSLSPLNQTLYTWLAINYLAGNFFSGQLTQGVIDVRDFSTGIIYETTDFSQQNLTYINMAGKKYTLANFIFDDLGYIATRGKLSEKFQDACFAKNFTVNTNFDLSLCLMGFKNSMQSISFPAINHQLSYALIADAFQTFDFFNIAILEPAAAEARIYYVCTTTWNEMQREYDHLPEKILSHFCVNAVFLDQLLFYRLALNNQEIQLVDHINKKIPNWTLGAMLYKLTHT